MLKWIFLLSLGLMVVLELWAMLAVGCWLGLGWTLAWVSTSCLIGIVMVRLGGVRTLLRIHQRLREGVLPTRELLDMGLLLVAGLLLVLPGFISDGVGLLLLLPPGRWVVRGFFQLLFGSLIPAQHQGNSFSKKEGEVVEVQAEDVT